MTKYFVDESGNYIGGFDGETGIDTSGFIEVETPPNDARQKWDAKTKKWGTVAPVKTGEEILLETLKGALPLAFTDQKIDQIKGA